MKEVKYNLHMKYKRISSDKIWFSENIKLYTHVYYSVSVKSCILRNSYLSFHREKKYMSMVLRTLLMFETNKQYIWCYYQLNLNIAILMTNIFSSTYISYQNSQNLNTNAHPPKKIPKLAHKGSPTRTTAQTRMCCYVDGLIISRSFLKGFKLIAFNAFGDEKVVGMTVRFHHCRSIIIMMPTLQCRQWRQKSWYHDNSQFSV